MGNGREKGEGKKGFSTYLVLRGSLYQIAIPTQRCIFPGAIQNKVHMYKGGDTSQVSCPALRIWCLVSCWPPINQSINQSKDPNFRPPLPYYPHIHMQICLGRSSIVSKEFCLSYTLCSENNITHLKIDIHILKIYICIYIYIYICHSCCKDANEQLECVCCVGYWGP